MGCLPNQNTPAVGKVVSFGADTRTRTADLRITNALLYHLSYIGLLLRSAKIRRRRRFGFVLCSRPPALLPQMLRDLNRVRRRPFPEVVCHNPEV